MTKPEQNNPMGAEITGGVMRKENKDQKKAHVTVGTIAHVDRGKTTLAALIARIVSDQAVKLEYPNEEPKGTQNDQS